MKQFRRKIEDIEAGAHSVAAEVLLIGLKHIREHRMSHPLDTTEKEWFDEIIPELIWFCEVEAGIDENGGFLRGAAEQERYKKASTLLGRHFCDIWC